MAVKELIWVGTSKKDLMDFSDEVRRVMGYGLYLAQRGEMSGEAKVLKGFGGAGVVEIKDSDDAGTYRAVYTVKMADVVFVLHVFQKKSKQGIKTPQQDIDLIHRRLKQAQEIYEGLDHEKK